MFCRNRNVARRCARHDRDELCSPQRQASNGDLDDRDLFPKLNVDGSSPFTRFHPDDEQTTALGSKPSAVYVGVQGRDGSRRTDRPHVAAWGDAPRDPMPPSDCPLGLIPQGVVLNGFRNRLVARSKAQESPSRPFFEKRPFCRNARGHCVILLLLNVWSSFRPP